MTIVRYTVKPGLSELNAGLIREVFAELERVRPAVRYEVFVDGDSFVHVADGEGLTELVAFRAFLAGHASRCVGAPVVTRMECVGSFKG